MILFEIDTGIRLVINVLMSSFENLLIKHLSPISVGPTSGRGVTLETGRWEVPDRNPGRACRHSRSEFSVVFFETLLNTG